MFRRLEAEAERVTHTHARTAKTRICTSQRNKDLLNTCLCLRGCRIHFQNYRGGQHVWSILPPPLRFTFDEQMKHSYGERGIRRSLVCVGARRDAIPDRSSAALQPLQPPSPLRGFLPPVGGKGRVSPVQITALSPCHRVFLMD